jgi:hypothetical protein
MKLMEGRSARILLIAGLAAVVILILLLIILAAGSGKQPVQKETFFEIDLEVEDFFIPEEWGRVVYREWIPYIDPEKKWTWEDVLEVWTDPVELGIKIYSTENDRMIEELMRDIK